MKELYILLNQTQSDLISCAGVFYDLISFDACATTRVNGAKHVLAHRLCLATGKNCANQILSKLCLGTYVIYEMDKIIDCYC